MTIQTARRRVYVAGPYSRGDQVANIHDAIVVGEVLWQRGYVPFIPHITLPWHLLYPKSWDDWLEFCLCWVETCDVLLRMDGESPGADHEVQFARSRGIPVVFSLQELSSQHTPEREGSR